MDIKKIAPWNWFGHEENQSRNLPAQQEPSALGSLARLHQDMDRLFENAFRDFGLPSFFGEQPRLGASLETVFLRPKVDISSTDQEYVMTVEVPGVAEEDLKLELGHDGTLSIRGEKRQEDDHKGKNFHRVERSYGSFERTLSLPDDVNLDKIQASFKNGVLTITCLRQALAQTPKRQIEIKKTA